MASKLTDEMREASIKRYSAGEKVKDIATEFGLHEVYIYQALKKAGVTMRGRGAPKKNPAPKPTKVVKEIATQARRTILRKATDTESVSVLKSENRYLVSELNQANRFIAKLAMGVIADGKGQNVANEIASWKSRLS
jgi:transposase